MKYTTYLGSPYPSGATLYPNGVNFSIYSENATAIELCLFDADGKKTATISIQERYHHSWHVFIVGLQAGQLYGYRVQGDYKPWEGARFNANKLLIDPYAKALSGTIQWHSSLFGYNIDDPHDGYSFSEEDSAPYIPKSVVIDPHFDWGDDKAPKVAYHKSVIYEAHVKGMTMQHPGIPENIRGTYSAMAHPADD